jgi:hypothetical protein
MMTSAMETLCLSAAQTIVDSGDEAIRQTFAYARQ